MRNDAGNVVDGKSGLVEDFPGRVEHCGDSLFVNFFPGHVDRLQIQIDVFTCDRASRTAAGHKQNIGVLAVATDVSADYAVSAAAVAQNSGASAISKKNAGIAIGPVSNRCQFLGTDYQNGVVRV